MAVARETVRLGLAARGQADGQGPPAAARGGRRGDRARSATAIERFADVVREELNVRELRFVSQADELGELEVKPNYRTLGPRFGKEMPLVAAAVAALDPARVGESLQRRPDRRDHRRRPGPRARRRRPDDLDEAARGLPGRARGLARGRARARDRRRAAGRGLGEGDRPCRAGRAARRRARRLRPDRADAVGRRGPGRRRARVRGLHRGRDARDERQLRVARSTRSRCGSTVASCASAWRWPRR